VPCEDPADDYDDMCLDEDGFDWCAFFEDEDMGCLDEDGVDLCELIEDDLEDVPGAATAAALAQTLTKATLSEGLAKKIKGAVNEMVKFADTNGNGKISSSEVQAALSKAGASTALTADLTKAFKDETDGKQVSKADIMKAALNGAKAAIANGDATETEISGALEYIAKNGLSGI